jgi:hypothetical protein
MGFISPTLNNTIKKIAVVLILILLIGGAGYEYFHLKKQEVPVSNAITAIPINASFIFESRKTFPLWKTISQTSLMWQDLLGTEDFAELNHNFQFLDSLTSDNAGIHALLEENPLFISAHINGQEHLDYLFCGSVGGASEQAVVLPYMQTLGAKGQMTQMDYEGATIYCLKRQGWSDFYYSFQNDIFIASLQITLVQQSLRQLQSHISLLGNKYFTKVLATSGGQAIANLFINFQSFYNVASPFMTKSFNSSLSYISDFAEWMELDLTFTPNEIIMSGFTDADSTNGQFLGLFSKQPSRDVKVTSVLPANTALLSCFEISEYPAYIKQYKQYLGQHRKIYKHNEWLDEVNKKYGMGIEKSFFSWIDNEVALVITEPTDSTLQNDIYAVVGASDIKDAATALDSLADSSTRVNDKEPFKDKYMNHDIGCIEIEGLMPNILGGTFELLKKSFYTTIGKYVVFANTSEALQMFINRYEGGNTLEKDSYYQSFIKDHVENESGLYVYNNIALSPLLYEQYLDKEYATAIKKHSDIVRKFQAVGMQMNYMQGMFYTNIYLKRNPQFKKQAGSLWQVALDTAVATIPCWVTDHKTKNKFVFVQDKADNVYLISNTGKVQWKKKVDGRLLSEASEVDGLKNGKLQYIFNTAKYVYVQDRNGNNFASYPVKLASPASGPITLFDYDKDKKYRILVPCEDREIREYDVNGKAVEGWAKPQTADVIKCTAKHIAIGGMDYVVMVDESGNVYSYDRKGETRIHFKKKLPAHIAQFYFNEGTKLSDTYMLAADSAGVVYSLNFADELTQTTYLPGKYRHVDFAPVDIDGDGKTDMVFLTPDEVYAYGVNKTQLFRYSAKDTLKNKLFTFPYPDGKTRFGGIEPASNKIYMWDSQGNVCSGFPLFGAIGFNISDMNGDGQHYLVTGSPDNSVYVYSLP